MRYFQKTKHCKGTYSEQGNRQFVKAARVGRVSMMLLVLVRDFSVASRHQLPLLPLRKEQNMTTSKSTLPAEGQISHNSGLWIRCIKQAERLAGTQGVWVCVWRSLAALNLFFAFLSSWNQKGPHVSHLSKYQTLWTFVGCLCCAAPTPYDFKE